MKKVLLFILLLSQGLEGASWVGHCREKIRAFGKEYARIFSREAWARPDKESSEDWLQHFGSAQKNDNRELGLFVFSNLLLQNAEQFHLTNTEKRDLTEFIRFWGRVTALDKSDEYGRALTRLKSDFFWGMGPFFFRWIKMPNGKMVVRSWPSILQKLDDASKKSLIKNEDLQFLELCLDLVRGNQLKFVRYRSNRVNFMDMVRASLVALFLTGSGYHPIDQVLHAEQHEIALKKTARAKIILPLSTLIENVARDSGALTQDKSAVFIADKNLISSYLESVGVPADFMEVYGNDPRTIPELDHLEDRVKKLDRELFSSFEELSDTIARHKDKDTIFVMFHGLSSLLPNGERVLSTYGEGIVQNEIWSSALYNFKRNLLRDGQTLVIVSCNIADPALSIKDPSREVWVAWSNWIAEGKDVKVYASVNTVGFQPQFDEDKYNKIIREKILKRLEQLRQEIDRQRNNFEGSPFRDPFYEMDDNRPYIIITPEPTYMEWDRNPKPAPQLLSPEMSNLVNDLSKKAIGLNFFDLLMASAKNSLIPDIIKHPGMRVYSPKDGIIRHIPADTSEPLPDQTVKFH